MITTEKQVQEIEEFLKSIALSVRVTDDIDLKFVKGWRFVKEDVNLCSCMFQLSHSYRLMSNSSHVIGFFRIKIDKGTAELWVSELRDKPELHKKVDNIEEIKEFLSNNIEEAIEILKLKKE